MAVTIHSLRTRRSMYFMQYHHLRIHYSKVHGNRIISASGHYMITSCVCREFKWYTTSCYSIGRNVLLLIPRPYKVLVHFLYTAPAQSALLNVLSLYSFIWRPLSALLNVLSLYSFLWRPLSALLNVLSLYSFIWRPLSALLNVLSLYSFIWHPLSAMLNVYTKSISLYMAPAQCPA